MKVAFEAGAYIRENPSYDPENIKLGTVDLDDVVSLNPLVEPVLVTHANGRVVSWVNLMGDRVGWVPLTKPDGSEVFVDIVDVSDSPL